MIWNGLTVCPLALLAVWALVTIGNRWARNRAQRRYENELAQAAMARSAVTLASRNLLRRRALRLNDMTPEQFRQALEEIEREGDRP